MEEIENPVESVHEEMHHHAQHSKDKWVARVALSSAIVAAFAAVGALLAGYHVNEAMIKQIQASDLWSYYQAKGIKAAIVEARRELLEAQGHQRTSEHAEKFSNYKDEQEQISEDAKERERESKHHLQKHESFARAVTLFQIAIAISAIAVLSSRKRFWYVGMGFSAVALVFFLQGLVI